MTNFIKKYFSRKISLLLIFVSLNGCAINNNMMLGSEVAEIALPLSFESQKRKIQKNPGNQLFYLNASKSRITYAYGILMEKGDRLMYSDYYKSRDYFSKSLDLFVISRNFLFIALLIDLVDPKISMAKLVSSSSDSDIESTLSYLPK